MSEYKNIFSLISKRASVSQCKKNFTSCTNTD